MLPCHADSGTLTQDEARALIQHVEHPIYVPTRPLRSVWTEIPEALPPEYDRDVLDGDEISDEWADA